MDVELQATAHKYHGNIDLRSCLWSSCCLHANHHGLNRFTPHGTGHDGGGSAQICEMSTVGLCDARGTIVAPHRPYMTQPVECMKKPAFDTA